MIWPLTKFEAALAAFEVARTRWRLTVVDVDASPALAARWESSGDAWHEQWYRDILVAVERPVPNGGRLY